MKKVVVASLLAVAVAATAARVSFAQAQPSLGTQQQGASQVQMSADEYKVYNNALTQTTPAAKAAAFEDYLKAYPQSAVKADVLQQLMIAYSTLDPAKTLDAADRLLQVDPGNLRALTFEVYFRKTAAEALTDATAKQAGYDAAAGYAQKGLAATKPKDMSDADFTTVQSSATPIFYSAIAGAAMNKKDSATAVDNYKKELASVPIAQTQTPGPMLQDTYALGIAYLQSTPPDLVNCAFYVARAAAFAPEPYKGQMLPTSKYCYKKYHGGDDGYDAVTTAAAANLNPPAGFTIKAAPSAADIAAQTIASTPNLATLAVSDKEFIMQNGKPEDADKVFATVKGKTVEIPDATVIAATDSSLQVAVSDDAVQTKTADFTFTMKEPLKTVPAVGSKVAVQGTYDSYTPNPIMITMTDASVVEKKAPAKKAAPAAHRPAHR